MTRRDLQLPPGGEAWWGQAVLFVNDDPAEPQAADFRDDRDADEVLALWRAFAGERDAGALHEAALAEFAAWRTDAPPELNEAERRVWRQSETVLRLGQVLEPNQPNRRNHGMFLAALPVGQWHIGWVRDGAYAIVAQALNGHTTEARLGLEFLLGAWAGFFSSERYLGIDYRISSVRYYGNGKEEGDFNHAGPNVETDGFGLTLWAARAYLHASCDRGWLDQPTLHGDTVFEALTKVAADIEATIVDGLPGPETSIWEVHWEHRQVFTYTAATQIRGLLDFADIARWAGRDDLAERYEALGRTMLQRTKERLAHPEDQSFVSHLGVADAAVYADGSTIELLSWNLVAPEDPLYLGTMREYTRLETPFGGYRRLEPELSLTGERSATEYDLSEWVFLDLRVGEAWRKAGDADRADQLLDTTTAAAMANDQLVPELLDPVSGAYAGAVPMVGYGAGAWQMAQLEKHGRPFPDVDAGFAHCGGDPPDPDPSDAGPAADAGPSRDAGAPTDANPVEDADAGTSPDGGALPPPQDAGQGDAREQRPDANGSSDDGASSLCSPGDAPATWSLALLPLLVVRRRRDQGRRTA